MIVTAKQDKKKELGFGLKDLEIRDLDLTEGLKIAQHFVAQSRLAEPIRYLTRTKLRI